MIWGHSWEIEQYNLWDKLEQCMELVKIVIVIVGIQIFLNNNMFIVI